MKRKLRIILIVLAIIIVLPLTVLLILAKVHHQSTHDEFVDFINHEFQGKITFDNFAFSYIPHFPNAHIRLEGVSVKDDTTEVLKIGQLDIIINTLGLWQQKISVKNLIITDAQLRSVIDSLGNTSKILAGKNQKSDSLHKALLIEADNIEIRKSKVYFENQIKGNRTGIHIYHAWLDVEPADSLLILKGKMDGHLDSLVSNNTVLFANQSVKAFDVVLNVNRSNGFKELKGGYILVHTLKLTPEFKMQPQDDGQMIELHISGEDNFDTFLGLFEFHTGIDLQQVKPGAKMNLSYNQKGFVNPFLRPYSELDFEISGAEFTGGNLPFPIEIEKIAGNYNNGEGHSPQTVELVIDTIEAHVSESFISCRFKLNNLHDPFIDAHIRADLDISHLVKQTNNIRLSGAVDFDLSLKGKISEIRKLHLEGKQTAYGSINVNHLELVLNDEGYSVELLNGASLLNNHILEITTLIGTFNKSAFHFQGHLENLDHYILNDKENLVGKFALNIDEIDLTKISFDRPSDKSEKQATFSPFTNLALEFIINARKIITGQGDVKNLAVDCKLFDRNIKINAVAFDYQEGHVSGTAEALFDQKGLSAFNADLKGNFKHLDIKRPEPQQSNEEPGSNPIDLPEKLNVELDLNIQEGSVAEVPLKNLRLSTRIHDKEIRINNFSVDAFGGHSDLMGRIVLDSMGIKGIQISGNLHTAHLAIDDLLNKFKKENPSESKSRKPAMPDDLDLTINLDATDVKYKDAEITHLKTKIKADNNRLELKDFYAVLPFGYLAMDVSALDYRSDQMKYSGWVDLGIDTLAVDKFMELEAFGIPGPESDSHIEGNGRKGKLLPDLPENINMKVSVKAAQLSYQNAVINDMSLLIEYLDNKINLEKLDFEFAGGNANVNGFVYKDQSRYFPGYVYSKVDSILLDQFFGAFDNFNQQVFTSQNTSGKISWASHYYFSLGEDLIPQGEQNFWILNFIVHETQLIQVKPIEDALFFVGHKAKDTMFIKQLQISSIINQDMLYFRDVMMNNNIANLDAAGIVDLGNKSLDVDLEISLSDLFFRTKKGRLVQTQEGTVNLENDAKLFLNLKGPLNDHKLSMKSKKKFNNFRKDLMKEIKASEDEFKQKQHKQ